MFIVIFSNLYVKVYYNLWFDLLVSVRLGLSAFFLNLRCNVGSTALFSQINY
jgi:hypothetical protein